VGLVRAKGHFWLAARPNWCGELSIAGAICRKGGAGFWWAAVPKERWPDHAEWKTLIESKWDRVFGDRRQELVFIGIGIDEAAIRAAPDDCLIGDIVRPRFEPERWRKLADPFPSWEREAA
jgi:G3E family GTPase